MPCDHENRLEVDDHEVPVSRKKRKNRTVLIDLLQAIHSSKITIHELPTQLVQNGCVMYQFTI